MVGVRDPQFVKNNSETPTECYRTGETQPGWNVQNCPADVWAN